MHFAGTTDRTIQRLVEFHFRVFRVFRGYSLFTGLL